MFVSKRMDHKAIVSWNGMYESILQSLMQINVGVLLFWDGHFIDGQ